jgi:predicted Zn-dependent protease
MMIKFLLIIFVSLLIGGCAATMKSDSVATSLDKILEKQGAPSGLATSVFKVGNSVVKSMEDISPEQEYYIGRSVSANILSRYRIYDNKIATAYINKIGLLLTYQSETPATYGGYHFVILDTDEINAFGAPGGFIFVTRGLLRCAQNEDAVAAILAHEISHITHQHGMRSVKSSRWSEAGVLLATEVADKATNGKMSSLVNVFQGSINDVVNTMVVNGYSRSYEFEADQSAYKLLARTGYNPNALIDVLTVMDNRLKPGSDGFASTHPSTKDRIAEFDNTSTVSMTIPKKRIERFKLSLAKI